MAIPKLSKVPIKTYSVNFLSFDSFKSPKRNIDFAAKMNPILPQFPIITKKNTNKSSSIQIYFPALSNEASLLSFKFLVHPDINSRTTTEDTPVIKIIAAK